MSDILQSEKGSIRKAIRNRRTVRKFKSDPVSKEVVLELLEDAVYAPNHKLTEPWRFVYVGTESGKQKHADNLDKALQEIKPDRSEEQIKKFRDHIMSVPAFLFVILKEDENERVRNDDFAAVSCLIQNLQLLAWEKGIGMVWKSGQVLYNRTLQQLMGLDSNERFAAILQLGYPAEIPKVQTRTPAKRLLTELS
ncbi:NAD(P)H nitroreductase [Bacillus glycinifermentans]|uniref:Putative NAD(P)H nitroreductase n=1 Tax=Bacillus glycinifermentans TaxID=1664069 RepID=A0A0J6DWP7_9BACI|nr:nitroreductase [Bacillus glycinifermentans]ATH94772.1 nitroreductase [Bacillus glycinifermentans]KMM52896.1 NAD(P)H nitroreductase [Bacillus glycinifermentans]KRT92055.1 NAD(P)H nitroreductase [Bacillus glycinifermentans]MEC0486505.1 nitroreductase [Bacillus glycinifermentans]MEC0494152.1 nitroreductase [Bacillus glycinifermentans]